MNVNEKLNLFKQKVMLEVDVKKRKSIYEVEEKLQEARDEAARKSKNLQNARLNKEKNKLMQANNKIVLDATADSTKSLIQLRSEYVEKIENNVVSKLEAFMKSADYEAYLMRLVKDCANKYKNVDIVLTEKDMVFADKIKEITKSGVSRSDEDFLGGLKAVITDKRAVLDYSFKTRLEEELKGFNYFRIS